MSRYVAVLVLVLLTIIAIVIGSYYLLTSNRRNRELKISMKSGERSITNIKPAGAVDPTNLKQTKYEHKNEKSNGRGNLINHTNECRFWSTDDRIHGGTKASIGDFPCIALLEYLVNENEYNFECAGSLINERYVITAAHCLHGKNLVNVRLGEYDISKNPDTDEDDEPIPEPINVGIETFIIHENYEENDIGLIRLSMDVPFEKYYRQPICIPNSTIRADDGAVAIVAGWGNTGSEARSKILQKVVVPIFNFADCQQLFANSPRQILPSQLCAGGKKGKDACIRDSGGPLVTQHTVNNIKRTYLEGIVSYGYGCGMEGLPGVYTRVSYYHDWILSKLQP